MATFDGTIHSPPANWDPYATPGMTPPTLLPQDPTFQYGAPVYGAPVVPGPVLEPTFSFATARRLLDEIRFDYVFIPRGGVDGFGVNDVELSATFAIPVLQNIETPLLITPGFAIHYWDGPKLPSRDLPARAYDAYLEGAWNPQMTPWLGAELALRVGVYSDFERVTSDSIRFQGKGLAVLSFSPSIRFKAGAWYLDRNHVKILPAGGIIWTPVPDVRFDILFPDPKIARRLANFGSIEWWLYARGEYGGGSWTVQRFTGVGTLADSIDYNDLRAALGLEFFRPEGLTGWFEVGLAFEREIRYQAPAPFVFRPDPMLFLRAGLAY